MNKWKVVTSNGDVEVSAHTASVTASGALVFIENNGALKRAFAAGAWMTCELEKAAPQGYVR